MKLVVVREMVHSRTGYILKHRRRTVIISGKRRREWNREKLEDPGSDFIWQKMRLSTE